MQKVNEQSSWDFREGQELLMGQTFENVGYIVDNADLINLNLMKDEVLDSYHLFTDIHGKKNGWDSKVGTTTPKKKM